MLADPSPTVRHRGGRAGWGLVDACGEGQGALEDGSLLPGTGHVLIDQKGLPSGSSSIRLAGPVGFLYLLMGLLSVGPGADGPANPDGAGLDRFATDERR